jgi:hypothetical protein
MPAKWQQWYPHNIDAWQSSSMVQSLSDAAYRAYHNLIQHQYQAEDGRLPISDKELARLSRAVDWKAIRKEVMKCFKKSDDGRFFSPRQYTEWERANLVHRKRIEAANATNERRKTVTEQSQQRSPHGHRTIRKRSPAHIDIDSNNTNTKTEEKEPPGAPAPDPEAVPSLVNEIVRAHPKSRLRKLQPREVTQAQEVAVLGAMADEIGPAVTDVQALEMIRERTEMLAEGVPRHEWRFFKDVVEFYRNHDYRMDPEDFAQHKGASNGRADTDNGMVGRVKRGLAGLREAADESGDYSVRPDAGGDDCPLPTSGDPQTDTKAVPGGVPGNGSETRGRSAAGSVAGHSPPTKPEILPPPERSVRRA